jgi:hypothetical protein
MHRCTHTNRWRGRQRQPQSSSNNGDNTSRTDLVTREQATLHNTEGQQQQRQRRGCIVVFDVSLLMWWFLFVLNQFLICALLSRCDVVRLCFLFVVVFSFFSCLVPPSFLFVCVSTGILRCRRLYYYSKFSHILTRIHTHTAVDRQYRGKCTY